MALVKLPEPALAPENLRPVPEPELVSNNFLVCLTISGAGSSLSLTPNRTLVEALLEGRVFALVGCCFGLVVLLVNPVWFTCLVTAVLIDGFGGVLSGMMMTSLTRAGLFSVA